MQLIKNAEIERYWSSRNRPEDRSRSTNQRGRVADADSNEELRQRVASFLQSRNFQAFRNFEIEVDRGTVTLTGKVESYYQRQVAITCQKVSGVVTVIDEIKVRKRATGS